MLIKLFFIGIVSYASYYLHNHFAWRTVPAMLMTLLVGMVGFSYYMNPYLGMFNILSTLILFTLKNYFITEAYYKYWSIPDVRLLVRDYGGIEGQVCRFISNYSYDFKYKIWLLITSIIPMLIVYPLFWVLSLHNPNAPIIGLGIFVIAILRFLYLNSYKTISNASASSIYHASMGALLAFSV